MSGFTFDSNIIIDALAGHRPALELIERALDQQGQAWASRMVWIEVLSKGSGTELRAAELFLSGFTLDEIDTAVARRAAVLRQERPKLRSPDAVILASALLQGRTLVTRNTKDFPATMPGVYIPYTF